MCCAEDENATEFFEDSAAAEDVDTGANAKEGVVKERTTAVLRRIFMVNVSQNKMIR